MKPLFLIVSLFAFHMSASADSLSCEFLIYDTYPFMEVQTEITNDQLGTSALVTHQGSTKEYPIVIETTGPNEKWKFTLIDGTNQEQIYVTVFNEAGKIENSFKSAVSNPAITIPALKDVYGSCTLTPADTPRD